MPDRFTSVRRRGSAGSLVLCALVALSACKDKQAAVEPETDESQGSARVSDSGKPGARATRVVPKDDLAASVDEGATKFAEAMTPDPDTTCPAEGTSGPDAALDVGARSYDRGRFAVAEACATLAADLLPGAVEAHHLRGAALAALERYSEAQVAFNMALALDPDDPETLSAAADFFINALPPKRRDTTLVGLEYARRGSDNASLRRRRDRTLRARLALLEGQALNDLGRADDALPRIEQALGYGAGLVAAEYEKGVSLFNLCRFEEAYGAFAGVLSADPDDPYAHHYLGLLYERLGRQRDANKHLARARVLAPGDFPAPVLLSEAEFRAEVDEAIAELPAETRKLLATARLEIADLPHLDDLTAVDPPFAPTILGLYRGLPAGASHAGHGHAAVASQERSIVLYRKNLARAVRTRGKLDEQIRRTLWHEIGHLRGLDEDELRRLGLE